MLSHVPLFRAKCPVDEDLKVEAGLGLGESVDDELLALEVVDTEVAVLDDLGRPEPAHVDVTRAS